MNAQSEKKKTISVTLSDREYELVKACVDQSVPMLVYEQTMDWQWCYCPYCHEILDREYMSHCNCCGQALSWYGTIKYAVRRSADEVRRMEENAHQEE